MIQYLFFIKGKGVRKQTSRKKHRELIPMFMFCSFMNPSCIYLHAVNTDENIMAHQLRPLHCQHPFRG